MPHVVSLLRPRDKDDQDVTIVALDLQFFTNDAQLLVGALNTNTSIPGSWLSYIFKQRMLIDEG